MAYQFIHMELYSRKGRDGRDVSFVLNEAARIANACLHVAAPLPPEQVYGLGIEDVRRLHDESAVSAIVITAAGRTRAIRKDQNSLMTIVTSHPASMETVRSNPDVARAVRDWEQRTVAWLREQYGDQVVGIVRHVDESHPHLHAYVLPKDSEMRAGKLHPGQEAKRTVTGAGPVDGEDAKSLNRRGDLAYKAAMRQWQDSYWHFVGLPCGLTRIGPGRRRLSREEWYAEQTQLEAVRKAQERFEALKASGTSFIEKTHADADAAILEARTRAAEIRAAALAQQDSAKRIHDTAETRLRKAHSILEKANREGARVLATARTEADRLRRIGTRIRSLWDGMRRSLIEASVRKSMADDLEREKRRSAEGARRIAMETESRRASERERDHAMAALHAIGRERDEARRKLAALTSTPELINSIQPTPSRR